MSPALLPEHPLAAPPEFPPGHDADAWLGDLYHGAWLDVRGGTEYRRWATRYNPLAFAVTYLPHLLKRYGPAGREVLSFCELHLDMTHVGASWAVPGPHRDGMVGPRGAAKSLWWIILGLWALAHGHRRFLLLFSAAREPGLVQLGDVREALNSELLLIDFPELRPAKGRGSRNTLAYVTASGATIGGRGLAESVLGMRHGAERPDLIVLDDVEPEDGKHTPERKIGLLGKLTSTILPMNPDAAVLLIGTPTMAGGLTHDLVRVATGRDGVLPDRGRWVRTHGFTPHYWPAVLDERTAWRRSLWPRRWSLGWLDAMAAEDADPDGYAMNYRCDPTVSAARRLWVPGRPPEGSYRYAPGLNIDRRVLSIDGAVSQNRTSDETAIVVAGQPTDPRRVVIEHAESGLMGGLELRERVWRYCAAYPRSLRTVVIEINNGGQLWREVLEPFPEGVEVIEYSNRGNKIARIEALHRHYARGAVLHAAPEPVGPLEDQQTSWHRRAKRDDLLDAASGAVRYFLTGWPGDVEPAAKGRGRR